MHTRRNHVLAIVEQVSNRYPGELSAVVAVPITDGDPTYLQWVRHQTNARTSVAAAAGVQ